MDEGVASALPLILIELVLVMGGVLAFGIWQIRSTRRDRERMQAERARHAAQARADATARTPPAELADPADPAQGADPPREDRGPAQGSGPG